MIGEGGGNEGWHLEENYCDRVPFLSKPGNTRKVERPEAWITGDTTPDCGKNYFATPGDKETRDPLL